MKTNEKKLGVTTMIENFLSSSDPDIVLDGMEMVERFCSQFQANLFRKNLDKNLYIAELSYLLRQTEKLKQKKFGKYVLRAVSDVFSQAIRDKSLRGSSYLLLLDVSELLDLGIITKTKWLRVPYELIQQMLRMDIEECIDLIPSSKQDEFVSFLEACRGDKYRVFAGCLCDQDRIPQQKYFVQNGTIESGDPLYVDLTVCKELNRKKK